MNQNDRDKRAIRTVLEHTGGAHFDEIALRAGEGLWPVLGEMLDSGEVTVREEDVPRVGRRKVFRLAEAKNLKMEGVSPAVKDYVLNSKLEPIEMKPVPLPSRETLEKVDQIMRKESDDK